MQQLKNGQIMKFRRRIKIAPGLTLNISKSGVSTTVGTRGASINFGKKGTYLNTSIPGTGFYSRKKIRRKTNINNVETPISLVFISVILIVPEILCFFFGVAFLFNGFFLYSFLFFGAFALLFYMHTKCYNNKMSRKIKK